MTTLAMPKPHGDRGMEGVVAKWYAANTAEVLNEYRDLAQRIATQPSRSIKGRRPTCRSRAAVLIFCFAGRHSRISVSQSTRYGRCAVS